jgi:hypothetical protein
MHPDAPKLLSELPQLVTTVESLLCAADAQFDVDSAD